ncbi:ATP-dependent nuclease [Microbulbifer sp. ZKSA006]|uniref:ATP-dependent nuclease n=1 Tax=Microbulbifer sp. ZKSA006 TaxID=3243390 RepID=UPI0040397D8C
MTAITHKNVEFILNDRPARAQDNQIVVWQTRDEDSDFSYIIRSKYKANIQGRKAEGEIFTGILKQKPEKEYVSIDQYLEAKRNGEEDDLFNGTTVYSMLPSLGHYRNLINSLGWTAAEKFLDSANDLIFAKTLKNQPQWLSSAIKSNCFKRAFMRNSEPFFAFHNAEMLFGEDSREDFTRISQKLSLSFQLDGFSNRHEIELRYDANSLIPRRINILIGRNGTGKSQALNRFCRAALQRKVKSTLLKDTDLSARPMISRLIAIETPGETANTFPTERKQTQKLYYRRLSLTRSSGQPSKSNIGSDLVQLFRSEDEIGKDTRKGLFFEAVTKLIPKNELYIQHENGPISIKRLVSGGEQEKLDNFNLISDGSEFIRVINEQSFPLSSGQLVFIKFALLCCLHIENGSFVVMDEPETHMHPNMISDFVRLLDFILENTGSQALIATHSSYFVREVPREQVHVIKVQDDDVSRVTITTPRLKTFGSDVDSISQFVFDERFENSLAEKVLDNFKGRTFKDIESEVGKDIALGCLMNIRQKLEGV